MQRVGLQRVSLPLREAPALEAGQVHVWLARPTGMPMPGVVPAGEFGGNSSDNSDRNSDSNSNSNSGSNSGSNATDHSADPSAAGWAGNRPESRVDRVRRERIAQKFLLRLLLGAYLDCPGRDVRLVRGRHGKPELAGELAGSDLQFNLSHAGGWLAIAVARRIEVGIDIEPADRDVRWPRLARRWFSPAECEALAGMEAEPARREFLRRWSLREALVKAAGMTMAGSAGRIAAHPENPNRLLQLPDGWAAPGQWSLIEFQNLPGLTGWLAAPGEVSSVRHFRLIGQEGPS